MLTPGPFLFCFLLLSLAVVARLLAPRIVQTIHRALPSLAARVALALLWTTVCSLSAQTIHNFKIDPAPITYNGKAYFLGARAEKVVDFFTSTTTPSVVLGLNGSSGGLWFYQSSGGLNGWGANPTAISKTLGAYYERAKSIRFSGRPWPDLVVSAPAVNRSSAGSTILFLNPLNPGGNGNPSGVWQQININPNSGCHDIKLADFDGDGLLDVICTGGAFLPSSEPFIAYQTSNLSVWNVVPSTVTHINIGDGVAIYTDNGINNVIGCSGSNTYIWENPLNFGGNPKTQTWPTFVIGPGASGNALGNLPGNMGVMVADSEEGTGEPPWTYGLVQLAPPSKNVFTTPWILTEIDSTVRTAHEINGGTLPWNSEPYVVFAEQEQRSAHCNSNGYFSAPDNGACRVGYYTYSNGAWSKSAVIVSTLGTQNQSVINYNGGLLIAGANFGTAGALDTSLQLWEITNGGEQNAPTPQISPVSGTYSTPQQVFIMDAATNPTIYYTIDGSTPTTSSPKYGGAFTVSASTTVKAIATASGDLQSAVASAIYTFPSQTAPPQFLPTPGTYSAPQSVTISDTTTGAQIYYTTDGSAPTTSSTHYTSGIPVSSSTTFKAIAVASGFTASNVVTASYSIQETATPGPTFSPGGGSYSSAQEVMLSDTNSQAIIYYTIDGTAPTTSSPVYGSLIGVDSGTVTIKAIAQAPGLGVSTTASATYTIQLVATAATPVFNPVSGTTFSSTLSVSITDTTPGATIYYTTDGSAPTTGSTAYSTSFTISATTTVNAIAVASGYTQSAQGSASYSQLTGTSPVSDEFNETSLDTALWQVRAPVGGSAAVSNGELVITVPAGSNHDATEPALDAVQVVEAIGNIDFDVAIKIDSSLTSATQYSEQGLLVEGNATNYIRFEIGAGGTTTVLGVSTIVAGVNTEKASIVPFSSYAVPTYLRLQRVGATFTAYWSTDGTTWTQFGTFTDSIVVTGLAPFAGNYSSTPSQATGLTAKFDWFHNRATDGP